MLHKTSTSSRRGALGLTLIEMSLLIALVGVAIIGLAERQFIEASQGEVSLDQTIQDMQIVSDALVVWAKENTPGRWGHWPYHLFSLVSGCTHSTTDTDSNIDRVQAKEYYRRLGACHTGGSSRHHLTGAYLFKLPASRFPPGAADCLYNCEYHFDKSAWRIEGGVSIPPAIAEGVTVQYVIERRDDESVEHLARQIALRWPNVTTVPVPGNSRQRIIRFRVYTPMECIGEQDMPHEADPLVYRCNEGRIVKFHRGDLRGMRRIALRTDQDPIPRGDINASYSSDSTPLRGPGITLPALPHYAISYQMRIGTQGVGRDVYLEMIRDKVPDGGLCTPEQRFGHNTCFRANFPLNWDNVNRFSPNAGIALRGYPGLPTGGGYYADPALWHFYGGGNANLRDKFDFDREPLVRLRLSNPVMDDEFRIGETVERDAHHDFIFGTRLSEPYMSLCADHAWANSTARIDTRRTRFRTYDQYVDEPCKTGVVLRIGYRDLHAQDDHWDISLTAEPRHRSLQERLCALEEVAPELTQDCTCEGSAPAC